MSLTMIKIYWHPKKDTITALQGKQSWPLLEWLDDCDNFLSVAKALAGFRNRRFLDVFEYTGDHVSEKFYTDRGYKMIAFVEGGFAELLQSVPIDSNACRFFGTNLRTMWAIR